MSLLINVQKIIAEAGSTLSLTEGETHIVLAVLGGYTFGKSSVSKRLRKNVFSFPVLAAALFLARAYRDRCQASTTAGTAAPVTTILDAFLHLAHGTIAKLPTSVNRMLRVLFDDAAGLALFWGILASLNQLSFASIGDLKKTVLAELYEYVKVLPQVQKILKEEKKKLEDEFERDLKVKSREIGSVGTLRLGALPATGIPAEQILTLMREVTEKENVTWETGRISGAVYHGVKSHQDLLNEAFGYYSISNPLHPDVWPSAMKYESEIIAMTSSLVRGGVETVCGATTSGGTESIILAIKSHRDYYTQKYHIRAPEMVACITAHAAVDKACDLMGIKLIKVPMDPVTCRADVAAMRRAIGPNTIMMYSSAPNYPQGVIDDVRALGALAVKHDIGLHVDCCLGGFFLPFAKKLGYSIPDFDFSVPGVSSMSLDTHKYGYALKGTSVVLYRTRELRQSQYFCYADWTGGLYTTPTIAGSRSGGLIAQCWASLVAIGESGYLQHTRDIWETKVKIAHGIAKIDGLRLLGGADAMIVCFVGDESSKNGVNVYSVADKMSKKGWSLNSHQHPPSVHICCTVRHVGREDELLRDLAESVSEVRLDPNSKGGKAAIYGMTSSLPSGPVNELLKIYNDVVLKL